MVMPQLERVAILRFDGVPGCRGQRPRGCVDVARGIHADRVSVGCTGEGDMRRMSSRSFREALLARWYILVAGFLVSLLVGAFAYLHVPLQYSSSGTLVLVKPKRADNLANPLLTFDESVNTTTLVVVQALNAPETATELGLVSGRDTFTAKNVGDVSLRDYGIQQPFITVDSQSSTPEESMRIVSMVLNRASQELVDLQRSMHVPTRNFIKAESVVDPESADPVRGAQMRLILSVVLLGMAITTLAAWVCHLLLGGLDRRLVSAPEVIDRTVEWAPVGGAAVHQVNGSERPLVW